jgi:hypothetical protein
VYALTRRAIDGLRNLLDSIAWAVYGGFSHMVTADDRHRARSVLHDVLWMRLALACLCAGIAIAVNRAFVGLLFGAENFGGMWLTAAFGLQMVLGGQAFLSNFLLRAAGQVREGSLLLAAEAVARVTAMIAGLYAVGLAGAPWAAAIVSVGAWLVMLRQLDRVLPASAVSPAAAKPQSQAPPFMVFILGVVAAVVHTPQGWVDLVATGSAVGLVGGVFLWLTMPAGSGLGALPRWKSATSRE